jgi:hypothetical protein
MKIFANCKIKVEIQTSIKLEVYERKYSIHNIEFIISSIYYILYTLLNYIFPNAPNLAGDN